MIKINYSLIFKELYKAAGILRNSKKMEQVIYNKIYNAIATIKEKRTSITNKLVNKSKGRKRYTRVI